MLSWQERRGIRYLSGVYVMRKIKRQNSQVDAKKHKFSITSSGFTPCLFKHHWLECLMLINTNPTNNGGWTRVFTMVWEFGICLKVVSSLNWFTMSRCCRFAWMWSEGSCKESAICHYGCPWKMTCTNALLIRRIKF
jgi:hypothetical protein